MARSLASDTSRALGVLALGQLVAAAILLVRGFPYLGGALLEGPDGIPLWERILGWFHLPGAGLLGQLGLCCGYVNGLVITDSYLNGHAPMTLLGVTLLALANIPAWAAFAIVVLILGRWIRELSSRFRNRAAAA